MFSVDRFAADIRFSPRIHSISLYRILGFDHLPMCPDFELQLTATATKTMIEVCEATRSEHVAIVRMLFQEYQRTLDIDLCFQGFERELATLPGDYAPPRGTLLLAQQSDTAVGCIALRALNDETCEIKRLYVRDGYRETGLGRRLVEHVIETAYAIGYRRMVLDTLPTMISAQHLYESLGFTDIAAYRHNPIAGTRFLGLLLGAPASS